MFNHARTLLANLSGVSGYFNNCPGEVLIPKEYTPVSLSVELSAARARLFGANPDRCFVNYRAAQLLQLINNTELADYVTALDSRVTSGNTAPEFLPSMFEPLLTKLSGDGQLTLGGLALSPDASGRCEYNYRIALSAGVVTVARTIAPTVETTTSLVFNNGLSQEIILPYSAYTFKLTNSSNSVWVVSGFLRPTASLPDILESTRNLSQEHLNKLFGADPIEPYLTFKNCWQSHSDFAYQLSGFALALIYRTEELRNDRS